MDNSYRGTLAPRLATIELLTARHGDEKHRRDGGLIKMPLRASLHVNGSGQMPREAVRFNPPRFFRWRE
jgi:hypothetical protein